MPVLISLPPPPEVAPPDPEVLVPVLVPPPLPLVVLELPLDPRKPGLSLPLSEGLEHALSRAPPRPAIMQKVESRMFKSPCGREVRNPEFIRRETGFSGA